MECARSEVSRPTPPRLSDAGRLSGARRPPTQRGGATTPLAALSRLDLLIWIIDPRRSRIDQTQRCPLIFLVAAKLLPPCIGVGPMATAPMLLLAAAVLAAPAAAPDAGGASLYFSATGVSKLDTAPVFVWLRDTACERCNRSLQII